VGCRNIPMECAHGQNGIARPSDDGTESFLLCFEAPIILRPFLGRIQTTLNTQFICWSFGPSVAARRVTVNLRGHRGVRRRIERSGVRAPAAQ
jgi:hypothetical protein